jgi:hypothetical protein
MFSPKLHSYYFLPVMIIVDIYVQIVVEVVEMVKKKLLWFEGLGARFERRMGSSIRK